MAGCEKDAAVPARRLVCVRPHRAIHAEAPAPCLCPGRRRLVHGGMHLRLGCHSHVRLSVVLCVRFCFARQMSGGRIKKDEKHSVFRQNFAKFRNFSLGFDRLTSGQTMQNEICLKCDGNMCIEYF